MKQGLLPLMPSGASDIHGFHSVFSDGTDVTWFQGSHAMRVHPASDHATQRAMMAFLHVHGGVPQSRIAAAVRVHENTGWAAVKRYRQNGDVGFYALTRVRGPAVMTPAVMEPCRRLGVGHGPGPRFRGALPAGEARGGGREPGGGRGVGQCVVQGLDAG